MASIFVSYRRSDSQDVTGRIYDRLVGRYAQNQIYKDVDSIPLGVSFPAHIRQLLSKANVVMVIIGPSWVTALDKHGRRRLEDPNDFVRLEVELALRAEMPVIPVLVSNARMPLASELPPSLRPLASRNGIAVRPDPDFNNDMTRLFSGLEHLEKLLKPKIARPLRPGSGEIIDAELVTEIIDAQLLALPPKPRPRGTRTGANPRVARPERPPPAPHRRPTSSLRLVLALFALAGILIATGLLWYVLFEWNAAAPQKLKANPAFKANDKGPDKKVEMKDFLK